MQERIQNLISKATDMWQGLGKTQKIRLIAVAAVLLAALAATIFLVSRPTMVVVLQDVDFATVGQAKAALEEQGIISDARSSAGGQSLWVNEKDANAAKILLVQLNIPNTSGFTYADAFSYSSLGTSDRITKESLKKAKETQIADSFKIFDGVKAASVTLELADESVFFWENQQDPTAAVILTTSVQISAEQANAMAQYLTRSVKGLKLANVEILDQNGRTIYSGMDSIDKPLASAKSDREAQKKVEIEQAVKNSIGPMFNDVKVISNIVLDFDESSTTSKEYSTSLEDSNTGLLSSKRTESSSMTNTSTDAAPGTDTNNNMAPDYAIDAGDQSSANTKSSEETYLVNETTTSVTKGTVGDIVAEKCSISVFAYNYVNYDEKLTRKNGLLKDTTWEDFKDATRGSKKIEVDESIINSIKVGTGIQNLEITGFEIPMFTDEVVEPIQFEQIVLLVILAILILLLAYGLIRKWQPDEITEIEPELSVEDLLVSTQMEEDEQIAETERLKELEVKESETKRQIEKFVYDKPEAVAQLLRNWLNEEWE